MIQVARKKKSFLKAICELAYGLLEPNILVLYVSQKKKNKEKKEWKKENGTLSLNIKQGMIFSNQRDFKEGRYENEAVGPHSSSTQDWSQEQSQNFMSAKTRLCWWINVLLNQHSVNLGTIYMQ